MTIQHKAAPVFKIKATDDDTGEFEGYGSIFGGEPDAHGDIVVRGAYTETLKEHKAKGTMPKMFWQHQRSEVIGKWLAAEEDSQGLLMRGKLNMGVQRGREAHALLKDGDIDGLSIGYYIRKYESDENTGVWYLKELDLFEVSVVSIGAHESATVSSVKALKATHDITEKLKAGDRLTEREFETLLKGNLGLSNSQAERAARIHLKGPGEPAAAKQARELLEALRA
ncbi:HK97 family phage prohead protease [Phaeobacter sp. JH20_09]|uniref:HK97 family phage prohead protease n=1 Tax=unclassified Phaeobacter TaxID=2621772 RepID=UPI003A871AE8